MDVLSVKDLLGAGNGEDGFFLAAGREGMDGRLKEPSVRVLEGIPRASSSFSGGGIILPETFASRQASLSPREQSRFLKILFSGHPDFIVIAGTGEAPLFFLQAADHEGVPLFLCARDAHGAENEILRLIGEKVHGTTSLHGVLVEIFGIGILISGESGIGKSECALELVNRGHKLISDDLVRVEKRENGSLWGRSPELTKYFMEIRGLGLVNVKSLFGVAAVTDGSVVEVNVELVRWESGASFDRIESEERCRAVLGVRVPVIRVPVRSGGNMATIVEIVAKNHILRKDKDTESREIFGKIRERISS